MMDLNETFIYPQSPAAIKVNKEELVKKHLHLVDFWVERMVCHVPSFMTRDDMASAARIGLFDAASRFDPRKGIMFKTFAEHRIRGAIIDEARKLGWFSRSMKDKQSRIDDAICRLENILGRQPEDIEIAEALEVSLDDYYQMLGEVSHLGLVSLHETLDESGDGRTLMDMMEDTNCKSPLESLEGQELKKELAEQLKKLTEKERLVISLFYYEELNQKEIAEVLNLTEGRVSQIHSQALIKLKGKLKRRA